MYYYEVLLYPLMYTVLDKISGYAETQKSESCYESIGEAIYNGVTTLYNVIHSQRRLYALSLQIRKNPPNDMYIAYRIDVQWSNRGLEFTTTEYTEPFVKSEALSEAEAEILKSFLVKTGQSSLYQHTIRVKRYAKMLQEIHDKENVKK